MAGPKLSAAEIRLLYEQHGAALLLYARSFVVDAAAGEDLVHEVLLKLLRGETSVPHTRNAALRYWLAFSELQDPPGDKATGDTLEKVSAGDAPWNDSLSPILDKNLFAIEIMERATLLLECDWGVEYDQGPRASIACVPRRGYWRG